MERPELVNAIEALLFAAAEPLSLPEIKKVFERLFAEESEPFRAHVAEVLKPAWADLQARWQNDESRGFNLVPVAEGFTFRSNPKYAHVLRALREEKPVRLSQAALETLAIVAYRQPVTKPDVDHIRGVDCGGTLRLLLDRSLIRIVGKKDEPGRPMLYGTTKEFLSFFNLGNLAQLPSLREFHELNQDSEEELQTFDAQHMNLSDLAEQAKKLRLDEEPAVNELDQAMSALHSTETSTRGALAAEGISLHEEEQVAEAPAEEA